MYDVEYTDYAGNFYSSLVDEVYYNSNTQELVVDLQDEIYKYTDVPADVYEAFVVAASKGHFYNTVLKPEYGPAEHVGNLDDVDYVGVTPVVKKDLDSTPVTKEFSLAAPVLLDDLVIDPEVDATREFSLQAPPAVELTDAYSYVVSKVHFTLDDGDKTYKYESNKDSLEDAIAEVDEYVSRLGAKGKVVKVVFKFV